MVVGLLGVSPASADAPNGHQIEICHATGDPWHYSTPNPPKHQIYDDHGHNSGGGVHPGDIIPPFSPGEQGSHTWLNFPGLNWDAEGQAIYNNGCVVPVTEEPPGDDPGDEDPPVIVEEPPVVVPPAEVTPAPLVVHHEPVVEAAKVTALPHTGSGIALTTAAGLGLLALGFLALKQSKNLN